MSNRRVIPYLHICIYMKRLHIYSICDKKGKVLCQIQYELNVLVNMPLVSINTNYTLLAYHPQQVSHWKMIEVIETWKMQWQQMLHQVRESYTKTLYTMNLHLHMHLHILKKWTEMFKNIVLTYSDIWIYINTFNIYVMS